MRKNIIQTYILGMLLIVGSNALLTSCGKKSEDKQQTVISTKKERNAIRNGNKDYEAGRYAEAEVNFKKALQENPANEVARFNVASSYLKQRGDLASPTDSLVQTANAILGELEGSADRTIVENSAYDRGNIAYKAENYAAAIEQYKKALRINPSNDQARENLRLAQLKKQEQDQNQDQNQDQDQNQQDQNKDQQEKDQNQDQNKDQQDKQDQNKDENKDQSQQNQDQQRDQQQEQQKQQGGLSDASAQQILQAMEDKENGTRQKVELMKQGEEKRANRHHTNKPW